jgi:hypothetical protein
MQYSVPANKRATLIPPIVLLVFAGTLLGQVTVTPNTIPFGTVGVGQTTTKSFVISTNRPASISSLTIQPPSAAFSLSLPPGGPPWYVGAGLTIAVTYRPISVATESVRVRIEFTPQSDSEAKSVDLTGQSLCGDDGHGHQIPCDPVRPLCVVSDNDETRWVFPVTNFFTTVTPAFDDISAKQATFKDFSMPVTFLWDIIGLAQYMVKPVIDCCQREIQFHHVAGSKVEATFDRTASSDIVVTSQPIPGMPTIKITVPAHISGRSYTTGTYTEFRFKANEAPLLLIDDGGNVFFDGALACFNSGFSKAVVRHANPGPNPPRINIVIK